MARTRRSGAGNSTGNESVVRTRGSGAGNGTGNEQPTNQEHDKLIAKIRKEFEAEMKQKVAAINKENEEKLAKLKADFQAQTNKGDESERQGEFSKVNDKEELVYPRPEDLSTEKVWKKIDRHHPKHFSGSQDPFEAEAWIKRLEAIFAAVVCNPYQKARVAILLLEGKALIWWQSVCGDDSLMTWDKFKDKFLGYHFPPSLRKEKENAFYYFKQGGMLVDQYIATFLELSRYISFLQRQDDPQWRIDQLFEKARPDLRLQVHDKKCNNVEEACEKLRIADRMMREAAAVTAKYTGGPGLGHQSYGRPFQPSLSRPSHSFGPTGGISKKFGASGSSSSSGSGRKSHFGSHGRGQSGSYGRGQYGSHSRGQSGGFGRGQSGRGRQDSAPWRFGLEGQSRGGSQVTYGESVQSTPSVAGPCSKCGRYHQGPCFRCFGCGRIGHTIRYCPDGGQNMQQPVAQPSRPLVQGRVFATSAEEAGMSPNMIRGPRNEVGGQGKDPGTSH